MVVLRKSIHKYFEKPYSNSNIEHKKAEIVEYANCLGELLKSSLETKENNNTGEPDNSVNNEAENFCDQTLIKKSPMKISPKKSAIFEKRDDLLEPESALKSEGAESIPPYSALNSQNQTGYSNTPTVSEDEKYPKLQITTVDGIVDD